MTSAVYDGYEAAAVCLKSNASLTSIHSYAENAFLTSMHLQYPLEFSQRFQIRLGVIRPYVVWIGLYSDNTWQWTDGTPLNYTHWLVGYPDNRGACVYMMSTGAETTGASDVSYWANWFGCTSTYRALCSMPART